MKIILRSTIAAAAVGVLAVGPIGQTPKAENGLLGIKLYDTGVDVVKKFGSPTDIQPVTFGTTATGGGGTGAPAGGPGTGGFAGAPGGGVGGGSVDFIAPPMGQEAGRINRPTPAAGGGPSDTGGGSSGGGSGSGGTQGTQKIELVRWIYSRGAGSSINFVLNKFNKVVQIEALGLYNRSARTTQGITLGSTMADVIKKYQNPDGYDISGDYYMVRFLRHWKVAFRFARETAKSPYRVTGIVVSAGKA